MTKTVSGVWDKQVGFRIQESGKKREIKAERKESSGTFFIFWIEKALVL
jgi:hypothetical protein